MTQSGNVGALILSFGILFFISIPALIWIWRKMFREEDHNGEQ